VRGRPSADRWASGVRGRGEGALTDRAQRQGTRALTDGPGHRARMREAVSCDLGHAIEIGLAKSNWEG
jgi:hypothetical protein